MELEINSANEMVWALLTSLSPATLQDIAEDIANLPDTEWAQGMASLVEGAIECLADAGF